MKIIAIEGLDKSGKHTQTKMLVDYLRSHGFFVEASEFHRYDTPTGQLIAKWLRKEWNVSQKTIELIMAADKRAQMKWFAELDNKGTDYLVLDRYIWSQLAYGVASGSTRSWLDSLLLDLRKPDYVINIDISAKTSMERKGKHGDNDRYESDHDFLWSVRKNYFALQSEFMQHKDRGVPSALAKRDVVLINGEKSVENVHEDIIKYFIFGPKI